MDALKFLSEMKRMCYSADTCPNCPLYNLPCDVTPGRRHKEENEEIVSKVEEWSNDHPIATRQSEFLKLHPNARIDDDGVLAIMPCNFDIEADVKDENDDCRYEYCFDCRRNYWTGEVE